MKRGVIRGAGNRLPHGGGQKASQQLRHATERAWSRCRLDLTQADVRRLGEKIPSQARFILKQSNTRTWYRVPVQVDGSDVWIPVVYDKTTRQIATFLTEEQIAAWRPEQGEWTDD